MTPTRKAWMILAESQEAFVHVLGTRSEDTRCRCLWRWSAGYLVLLLLLLRRNRSKQVSGNDVWPVLTNRCLRIVFHRGFSLEDHFHQLQNSFLSLSQSEHTPLSTKRILEEYSEVVKSISGYRSQLWMVNESMSN